MNRTAPSPARQGLLNRKLLTLFVMTLALSAWVALRSESDTDEPAHSKGQRGQAARENVSQERPPTRKETSAADNARAHRLAQTIASDLSLLADQRRFPPLSETGRKTWAASMAPAERSLGEPGEFSEQPEPPPKFPYRWVGVWEQTDDDGSASATPMVVISGADMTWVLKRGDAIEGQWRIDSFSSTSLQLTYLPRSLQQTIFLAPQ